MGSKRVTARSCTECARKNPGGAFFCVGCFAPLTAKPFDLLLGQDICGYLLDKKLGESDLGVVFLARRADQLRVVRVLAPRLSMNRLRKGRLLETVKRLSKVHCPNIVKVLKIFVKGGFVFLVTPFIAGGTVRALLDKRRRVPRREALAIVQHAARALVSAARVAVVHGDVKPENLLLTGSGDVLLGDFGLRRVWNIDAKHRAEGTPEYMSPEHLAKDRTVDVRSDLFSLGCLLYELLHGKVPFLADSMPELLERHRAVRIAEHLEELPPLTRSLIVKLLARDPADRYQTPLEVCDAIEEAKAEADVEESDAENDTGYLDWEDAPVLVKDDERFANLAELSQSRSEQYMLFESQIEDPLGGLSRPSEFAFPDSEPMLSDPDG